MTRRYTKKSLSLLVEFGVRTILTDQSQRKRVSRSELTE